MITGNQVPALRRALGVALVVGALGLATISCATTYDEGLVADTSPATTTTLPAGVAADLLPRLADRAASLSGVMIDGGDDDAVAEQIASLWTAARDEVQAERPDLVDGFERSVAMIAKAVEFRRAADADKAAKNLTTLVDAFLA